MNTRPALSLFFAALVGYHAAAPDQMPPVDHVPELPTWQLPPFAPTVSISSNGTASAEWWQPGELRVSVGH